MADFLRPEGFSTLPVRAGLRELGLIGEMSRHVVGEGVRRSASLVRRPRAIDADLPAVVLVPGFCLGDASMKALNTALRRAGRRTYSSHMYLNVGCPQRRLDAIEARVEEVAERTGAAVQIVGHSLGGMLAKGVAARRPDLVSDLVTLASPMRAPGAIHPVLTLGVEAVTLLGNAGVPGLMSSDCVSGECARTAFEVCQSNLDDHIGFTTFTSPRDGMVDHRACADPRSRVVGVRCSHFGIVVDRKVHAMVARVLDGTLDVSTAQRRRQPGRLRLVHTTPAA